MKVRFLGQTERAVYNFLFCVDAFDRSSLHAMAALSVTVQCSTGPPFACAPRVAPWKGLERTSLETDQAFLLFQQFGAHFTPISGRHDDLSGPRSKETVRTVAGCPVRPLRHGAVLSTTAPGAHLKRAWSLESDIGAVIPGSYGVVRHTHTQSLSTSVAGLGSVYGAAIAPFSRQYSENLRTATGICQHFVNLDTDEERSCAEDVRS